MKHRADIDGLRALAVIAVVLYHTRLLRAPGGYTGVDVFFVISGYLITGLILTDIQKGAFSIANFYERRARRILPALFGVLVAATAAAYRLFLPRAFEDYGLTLAATALFSSNIVFARQTGYFDAPAETEPLLHTWSLAVEEQFYIGYPIFLYLVSRFFRKRFREAIGIVFALSLAASISRLALHPASTFYQTPTRAWELMLGSLLAVGAVPVIRGRAAANLAGIFGLGLIGYATFGFTAATPFPGANALYPCVGAALVIYAGTDQESLTARLLSTRPLVFVGLISYSLYLWHWVILVFARAQAARPLSWWESAAVVASSLAVATLSWRYIETPFRGRRGIGTRRAIFSAAAAVSTVLAFTGALVFARNGMPARFGGEVRALASGANDLWKRRMECMGRICRVGTPDVPETFMLWGDSHAGALGPALERVAWERHLAGAIAFKPACAPLLGLKRYEMPLEDCKGFAEAVLAYVQARRIRKVILHGRWGLYAEGSRYGTEPGLPALLTPSWRTQDDYAEFERLLRVTLGELRARNLDVVIMASVPEVGVDVPSALAGAYRAGRPPMAGPSLADFQARQHRAFDALQHAAADESFPIVYPHELLCDTAACAVVRDQRPLYSDEQHLSVQGAMALEPLLDRLLR